MAWKNPHRHSCFSQNSSILQDTLANASYFRLQIQIAGVHHRLRRVRSLTDAIVQLDHAVSELRAGDQFQWHGAAGGRDQWNAFAYKFGNHVNHELVDLSFVEKRRNDASATHHPDVFPLFCPQTGCERFDRFVHEFHARRRCRLRQTACEYIVPDSCIEGRRSHAIVTLRTRTVEPVEGAIEPGNKAVGTHGDVDDDFSLADHSVAATNPKAERLRISINRPRGGGSVSDNPGGLNGSTQHQLEVYLQKSQQLKSFASVDSNGTLPCLVLIEYSRADRFSRGKYCRIN